MLHCLQSTAALYGSTSLLVPISALVPLGHVSAQAYSNTQMPVGHPLNMASMAVLALGFVSW